MPWAHKRIGKRRRRELRVIVQLHRKGSKKAGHGWAARQASRRKS